MDCIKKVRTLQISVFFSCGKFNQSLVKSSSNDIVWVASDRASYDR